MILYDLIEVWALEHRFDNDIHLGVGVENCAKFARFLENVLPKPSNWMARGVH